MSAITDTLAYAVFAGNSIPSHDMTHDLADEIGARLEAFRTYVTEVRSAEQATDALTELGTAIASAIYDATRPGVQ